MDELLDIDFNVSKKSIYKKYWFNEHRYLLYGDYPFFVRQSILFCVNGHLRRAIKLRAPIKPWSTVHVYSYNRESSSSHYGIMFETEQDDPEWAVYCKIIKLPKDYQIHKSAEWWLDNEKIKEIPAYV